MKILSWNVNSIRVRKNQLLSVIKKENPDITDAKIKYSMNKLKEYGIVETNNTQKYGIGYFSPEKIRKFYKQMLKYDVVKELDDINEIYNEEFIQK